MRELTQRSRLVGRAGIRQIAAPVVARLARAGWINPRLNPEWSVAMTIVLFGLLAFAVIFGGGIVGFIVGELMPESYNDAATRAVMQTAMRTVSLLAALVLGLLVATAKNKFDTSNMQVERFASDLMSLDRELANYGPEASDIRSLLRKYTVAKIASTWPSESAPKPALDDLPPWRLIDAIQQQLRRLTPQSGDQRATLAGALQIAGDLAKATWLQKAQGIRSCPAAVRARSDGVALYPVRRFRRLRDAQRADRYSALRVRALDRQRGRPGQRSR